MLELHPDARRSFDRRAQEIASGIQKLPHANSEQPTANESQEWAQPYVTATVAQEDLVEPPTVQWQKDVHGEDNAVILFAGDDLYLIHGDRFRDLRKLATQMSRTGDLRDTASYRTILELLAEWIRRLLQGDSVASATTFILERLESDIAGYTVLFPVHELFIEKPFQIGNVRFRSVIESDVDQWFSNHLNQAGEQRDAMEETIVKWKRRIQGRAAAEITVNAERRFAVDVALERTEEALAMLRVFLKATAFPRSRSYCNVLGKENVEKLHYFLFQDDVLQALSSELLAAEGIWWRLDSGWIDDMMGSGLGAMSELLRARQRSRFQNDVIDALLLYSRCSLERSVEAKLIYIFAALESILLRSQQEAIQDNVGHRVAYVITKGVERRRRVIRTVKDAYALRSKFFHHGIGVDEYDTVREFMKLAWIFFTGVCQLTDRFDTTEDFLEYIEMRRLGG